MLVYILVEEYELDHTQKILNAYDDQAEAEWYHINHPPDGWHDRIIYIVDTKDHTFIEEVHLKRPITYM